MEGFGLTTWHIRDRATGLAMYGADVTYKLDSAFASQDHEASCPICYRIAYLLRLAAGTQPLAPQLLRSQPSTR